MNTYRKINIEIVGFCTSFSLLFKKIIKKLGGQWWQHLCTFRIFVIIQISNEQKVVYYFHCNIFSGKKKAILLDCSVNSTKSLFSKLIRPTV